MSTRQLKNLPFGFEFEGSTPGGASWVDVTLNQWGKIKTDNSLSQNGFELASYVCEGWSLFRLRYLSFINYINSSNIGLENAAATHFHCCDKPFRLNPKILVKIYQVGVLTEPFFYALKTMLNSELTICKLRRPEVKLVRYLLKNKTVNVDTVAYEFQAQRQSVINFASRFEYAYDVHNTVEFRPLPSRLSIDANKIYLKMYKNILKLAFRTDFLVPFLYEKYVEQTSEVTLQTIKFGANLLGLTTEDVFILFTKNPRKTQQKLNVPLEHYVEEKLRERGLG